jgi:hypothetical protein
MTTPDAIAAVSGYRTWAMGMGQLWSAQGPARVRWPTKQPLKAICLKNGGRSCFNTRRPSHSAPDSSCTCGAYGVFAPWDLDFAPPPNPWTLVVGRVEGWGRVALGETGFRAEIATPLELFAESWWEEATQRTAARVADVYEVPLLAWESSRAPSTSPG